MAELQTRCTGGRNGTVPVRVTLRMASPPLGGCGSVGFDLDWQFQGRIVYTDCSSTTVGAYWVPTGAGCGTAPGFGGNQWVNTCMTTFTGTISGCAFIWSATLPQPTITLVTPINLAGNYNLPDGPGSVTITGSMGP